MKKLFLLAMSLLMAFVITGCGRIEDGHHGIRTSWNKVVQNEEVRPGFYVAVFDSVTEYVTNEITVDVNDLKPQTADKTNLADFDVTVIYSVDPTALAEMHRQFKGRHQQIDGDWYPMRRYVSNTIESSVPSAVLKWTALQANEHRKDIESDIAAEIRGKFERDGLAGKIRIHSVNAKRIVPDPRLNDSILNVVRAQKEQEAKQIEVQTAKLEAERMAALSKQGGTEYIELLTAQANMKLAEAVAAGKVHTIVVPHDFKGIVNVK